MNRKRVFVDHDFYDVHVTDEYDEQITETYKKLGLDHSEDYADRWLDRLNDFVEGLQTPRNLGVIDPENYSDTYSYIQILNTETTVFLLVEENQIFLATAGWSGRDWPRELAKKEPQINQAIEAVKKRFVTQNKNSNPDDPPGKEILPPGDTKNRPPPGKKR